MAAIHTDFKGTVRERRGDRLRACDEELFEGQIWTGQGALGLGLVDGLGELHGVLRERFGDKVKLPQISAARPWWQRRLSVAARRRGGRDGGRRARWHRGAHAVGPLRAALAAGSLMRAVGAPGGPHGVQCRDHEAGSAGNGGPRAIG